VYCFLIVGVGRDDGVREGETTPPAVRKLPPLRPIDKVMDVPLGVDTEVSPPFLTLAYYSEMSNVCATAESV